MTWQSPPPLSTAELYPRATGKPEDQSLDEKALWIPPACDQGLDAVRASRAARQASSLAAGSASFTDDDCGNAGFLPAEPLTAQLLDADSGGPGATAKQPSRRRERPAGPPTVAGEGEWFTSSEQLYFVLTWFAAAACSRSRRVLGTRRTLFTGAVYRAATSARFRAISAVPARRAAGRQQLSVTRE